MIDDPYLLLYLSSFLNVRDFISLSRTARLFTDDPLITDEIKKRIRNNTSADLDTIKSKSVTIYESNDTTCLVFPVSSTVEFTSEKSTFHIQTPNWRFHWSGVLFNNDVTDLRNSSMIVHLAETPYASLDVRVFCDETDVIHLD